jgi:hypothetical protein
VVGAGQRQQPDLLVAGAFEAGLHHLADAGERRSRTGRVIMPGLAEAAAAVQPRKISTLIRSCTVSASGTSGCFGYGPLVEVHDGALVTAEDVGPRRGPRDAPSGVIDV